MTEHNDDELNAPEWLNRVFIQDVLRSAEKDDTIEIIDLIFSPATAKGDHYATIMFRATIQYRCGNDGEVHSKSIIIKILPEEEGHKRDAFKGSDIFKTEIQMFGETIPKFEEILRKAGDNTRLSAKMLYYAEHPKNIIVFDDLVPQGYQVIRNRLLNLEETKAAIRKLAKWHAVSYKLGVESNPLVTRYSKGFFDLPNFKECDYATKGIELFSRMLATVEGYESYIPKLRKLEKGLVTKCVDIFHSYQNGEKGLFVLNHGDFHLKNMMFQKNDDGTVEDVLLLDFQLCFFGPATVDLTYATFTCFDEDVRRKHREEMMYFYVTTFMDTLRKIEFPDRIPTMSDFCKEFINNRRFEIFTMTTFFPPFYGYTHPNEYDVGQIMQSSDYRGQFYFMPKFIEEMKEELPKYLYRGYLD